MNEIEVLLETKPEESEARPRLSRWRLLSRLLGIFLLTLSFLLALYGAITYVAWNRGQTTRLETARQELEDELLNQLNLARDDVTAGRYVLAQRRLEWVLAQNPEYPGAVTLFQEAQAGLNALLTPTLTPTAPPTATPEATPDTTAQVAAELAQLTKLVTDQQWQEAITGLTDFQSDFPNYERRETDLLLYEAYLNLGLSMLPGDQVELGLFYLSQAERLGDLPAEANDQRLWAQLYLEAIAYYRVDWSASNYYFRDLCLAAPFFHDACGKLYEGLIGEGDQYAAVGEWCPAYTLYAEARQHDYDDVLGSKLAQSRDGCLNATPTPDPGAVITDTVPITNTEP
jgi:hypothetical protein